ncbi:MAG: TlpA family protein disulfide reductase [Myxococcaceae bacterium]|nr:TlpA family protein disulfide reductase [Myxococcaceae bacterium]
MRFSVGCVCCALVVFLSCAPKSVSGGEQTAVKETKGPARATDFSLRSLDGKTVRLSDHLGKDVVMLTFWATWCLPCLGEMPKLEALHQKYKDQGFTVLGISMDGPESIANVDPTVRRYGVTYPILLDEETRVASIYNPTRDAPFAVLIDRSGKIVETRLGYAPGDEVQLEKTIVSLLNPQPSAGTP